MDSCFLEGIIFDLIKLLKYNIIWFNLICFFLYFCLFWKNIKWGEEWSCLFFWLAFFCVAIYVFGMMLIKDWFGL